MRTMIKWEYLTVWEEDFIDEEVYIEDLGAEGWEMCGISVTTFGTWDSYKPQYGGGVDNIFYFKRPLNETN